MLRTDSRKNDRRKRLGLAAVFVLVAYLVHREASDDELEPIPSEGPPRGMAIEEWGAYLFGLHGCTACHSVQGVRGVGGSLDGIVGQRRHFTDGSEGVVDRDYLRESIVAPERRVVLGFTPSMPRHPLRDTELTALIAYIESLSPN